MEIEIEILTVYGSRNMKNARFMEIELLKITVLWK